MAIVALGARAGTGVVQAAALAALLLVAPTVGADQRAFAANAGLAMLSSLTYGRDIPLPQATYKYKDAMKADLVVVFKSRRELHLMNRGEVVGTYRIALGFAPKGHKLHSGDGRTPEGVYTLDWRNPNSRFHRSIRVSYPGPHDRERALRRGVNPGNDIMIHGLPNGRSSDWVGHPYHDWTEGCIAVTNEEMDDIWARVDDGTTIIIYP